MMPSEYQTLRTLSKLLNGYKRFTENVHCYVLYVYICVFVETDKQLVELIHVKALNILSAHQQSALRYQSVTLFLRGRSTPYITPTQDQSISVSPITYLIIATI